MLEARNLYQLIGTMSRLSGNFFFKNHYDYFSYCPLKILKFDIAILQLQYLKKYKR